MPNRLAHFLRACLAMVVCGVAFGTGIPAAAATGLADVDIRIVGGNSSAAIVCGNVAVAQDFARQRGIVLQKSKCTAAAIGGDATLQNVEIFVSAAAREINRDNPVLALLAAGPVPGVANDACENHRPSPGPGQQLNKCFAFAQGGKVKLNNVTHVDRQIDGRTVTRTIDAAAIDPGNGGTASAVCANLVNHPMNQRDDCTGTAGGGSWSMRAVDVVMRNPDGSTSTRRGVTVEVRGGTANASLYCFNVIDGAGPVVQINICRADAKGGNVTLKNVTVHTT